jgi:hypothetical protein
MNNIKQMKLLSGEEILCDLVDVTFTEEEGECMIIRAAYVLVSTEDFDNGLRYYTFRPFMMNIYDPSKVLLLNTGAVICLTTPNPTVVNQYEKHIEQFKSETIGTASDELSKMLDEAEEAGDDDKLDTRNVVDFKSKLH